MRAAVVAWAVVTLAGWAGAQAGSAVLLLPFEDVSGGGTNSWIGRAVQQSLLSDLSRGGKWQPIVPATQPAQMQDVKVIQQAGRSAGADYVVYGSYQLGDVGLRITGQVLEVSGGRLVGGIKATGTMRDLFALEDTLAQQARRILDQQQPAPPAAQVAQQPPEPIEAIGFDRPWAGDEWWIDQARQRQWHDSNYYRGYWGYYYGTIGVPYGRWYPPGVFYSHRSRYHGCYGGVYFFPGGVIRTRY